MRSGSVEIVHIRVEHAVELFLMQDEQMIKALTSHTAQEPLTDGIGSRGVIGGFEHLDVTRSSQPRETHSNLAIVITDEVFRTHPIGSGFSNRYVPSKRRWETVSHPRGSLCASAVRQ
jgi:hypothetical protein